MDGACIHERASDNEYERKVNLDLIPVSRPLIIEPIVPYYMKFLQPKIDENPEPEPTEKEPEAE